MRDEFTRRYRLLKAAGWDAEKAKALEAFVNGEHLREQIKESQASAQRDFANRLGRQWPG